MNPDQRANLDAAVLSVGKSLVVTWSYFHVLRGLDNGRLQNPNVVLQHGLFYDRLWRVAFDAFFAKVGIVLDTKRNNYSLPNLLTLARRYGTPELRRPLLEIQNEIDDENSSLAKLKRWRHEIVAHKPTIQVDSDFHAKNGMTLSEIEAALGMLDDYLNRISFNFLSIHSEHRSVFEAVVQQAESMFAACARGNSEQR